MAGAGAVLATAVRGPVALLIDADAMLLASLTVSNRELVLSVLEDYPALPVAKCIAMLREGGM